MVSPTSVSLDSPVFGKNADDYCRGAQQHLIDREGSDDDRAKVHYPCIEDIEQHEKEVGQGINEGNLEQSLPERMYVYSII